MLSLYRRHRRDCTAHHQEDSKSGELQERAKTWKRCSCPIFASGSLNRSFKRQSTGKWEWEPAKAIAAAWEARDSWEHKPTHHEPPPAPRHERITIQQAVTAFLGECKETSAPNTQKRYTLLLKKLQNHADNKGLVTIDQWTTMDVRALRTSWTVAPTTAAKNLSTIKSFFEFCVSNDWLRARAVVLCVFAWREILARSSGRSLTSIKTRRMRQKITLHFFAYRITACTIRPRVTLVQNGFLN